jgi:hypothetical protein
MQFHNRPDPHAVLRASFAVLTLTFGAARPCAAQALDRFSLESVIGVDVFRGENVNDRPAIIVDVAAAVRLSDGWQFVFRPWLRLPRPGSPTAAAVPWEKEIWQAGVRYERPGAIATRVDAGYMVSPIGLGLLDNRPDLNPVILTHLSYVIPMLPFDPTVPRQAPVAGSYPLGTLVTLSTNRWDARASILNSSPTRAYAVGDDANPRQTPSVVFGGGVTPTIGLRLGGNIARGLYATRSELTRPAPHGYAMTLVSGEGEYAFRYTKLSGEIVRTSFEASTTTAVAYEWFIQGMQTLTPRWFLAARHEGVSAPPFPFGIVPRGRTTFKVGEMTGGYRVNRDITLRSSYVARRFYGGTTWDHQVGASLVWAHRWR